MYLQRSSKYGLTKKFKINIYVLGQNMDLLNRLRICTYNDAQHIKIILDHNMVLQNRSFYNSNIKVYICFGIWHLCVIVMCAIYWPRLSQPWAVYGAQHKCSTIFLTMFLKFWPAWLVKEKIFLKFYILSEKKYLKLLLFPFYKFALIWQTYIDLIKIFKL